MLSSERDLLDFLNRMERAPLRVLLERPAQRLNPSRVYQADTDHLRHGLELGTFLGLKLAFTKCEGLSAAERRLAA